MRCITVHSNGQFAARYGSIVVNLHAFVVMSYRSKAVASEAFR